MTTNTEKTNEELSRDMARNTADLAENNRQIAYLTGQIEASVEALRQDPELVALVEAEAQRRGVPITELMDETMTKLRKQHVPDPLEPTPVDETHGVDPAVAAFRQLLS